MIAPATVKTQTIRCAIYTRKSVTEGLDQDFNTLDSQREAAEAFILSRKQEGWICLPERYDDGGFSGGNIERPALKRLMADIKAGRIDAVVCYKVDRLSRSLLDFTQLIDVFDRHGVMFVSVTQPINTADSSGRLMLNVLLSFAQFEREMIADRTRDKVCAARRRGKWTGGIPVLGYDVHPDGGMLVVNEEEAETVRQIFSLYLELQSLQRVARELNRRGWRTKSWVTKKGTVHEGAKFQKSNLSRLLSNPLYIGKVKLQGQVYEGEHPGIVAPAIFQQVQTLLQETRVAIEARRKNKYGHLLGGLLHCTACGARMSPSGTLRKGRVYRYYVCGNASRNGWKSCPHPSLPAGKIEAAVVARIKAIGKDPELLDATLAQIRSIQKTRTPQLRAEQRRLESELDRLKTSGRDEDQKQIIRLESRLEEIAAELAVLDGNRISKQHLKRSLALFDDIWDYLFRREQERILNLLIERIDFHAETGTVTITFRQPGIRTLADEVAAAQEATG